MTDDIRDRHARERRALREQHATERKGLRDRHARERDAARDQRQQEREDAKRAARLAKLGPQIDVPALIAEIEAEDAHRSVAMQIAHEAGLEPLE